MLDFANEPRVMIRRAVAWNLYYNRQIICNVTINRKMQYTVEVDMYTLYIPFSFPGHRNQSAIRITCASFVFLAQ